ncbi:LapA family protein [Pseudomarimonas salicorniae]|uniref:Lipopolysaccharide assembly protein LapA domain-containing protein n=1 Tax=Pseudomarimonas salicorniae TaxID=2933270 RepID=A0ABT0GK44_9GAMM|nr:LapA family protein [Lysobacter sp. CAU 1642]MCK7594922.1 lipopolysaccharide assembly protein LapA domain-containing protein [Lysobacter sp. CAU 1642]
MRWLRGLLVLVVVALGLAFGALNDGDVAINLHYLQFSLSTGAALIGAALVGALVAGLCLWLAVIWPLQRRLRRARRDEQRAVGTALEPVEQDRA